MSMPEQPKSTSPALSAALPSAPCGMLPPTMHVLLITGTSRTGGWLAEALAHDSASRVQLEEAIGMTAGLARLREEVFDAVLIGHADDVTGDEARFPAHAEEIDEVDSLQLLDCLTTASREEQPILVLGTQPEAEMAALCYEAGADAYLCISSTTVRSLIWQVARAIERHRLIAENRRLTQSHRQNLQREHDEASWLLAQQRALIDGLEQIRGRDRAALLPKIERTEDAASAAGASSIPPALLKHYRELLRAYVIMGSGNFTQEMRRLADELASAGLSAQQAMRLHLLVLEEMVQGLGSRSARHVMNRADLLILEMMINLADDYRQRYEAAQPPVQPPLPRNVEAFARRSA